MYKLINNTTMKQYLVIGAAAIVFLSSCGNSKKEGNADLNDKKAALEKLKGDKDKIDTKITSLETEIAKLDTSAAAAQKTKLVAVQTLAASDFAHYIELQGRVDAENVSYHYTPWWPGPGKSHLYKTGRPCKKRTVAIKTG